MQLQQAAKVAAGQLQLHVKHLNEVHVQTDTEAGWPLA
jgi:hypothetical protein